tara:strand:+ start:4440 stop:4637 length:198 start_codon:yes stop_codon:yes gene_type:complete
MMVDWKDLFLDNLDRYLQADIALADAFETKQDAIIAAANRQLDDRKREMLACVWVCRHHLRRIIE